MSFFIDQDSAYVPATINPELAGTIALSGSIDPFLFAPVAPVELNGSINLSGEMSAYQTREGALNGFLLLSGEITPTILTKFNYAELNGSINLSGEMSPSVVLPLVEPDPIITEISPSSFSATRVGVRFLVNGVKVPIKSFEFSKPRDAGGQSLSITLAKADLALIPDGAVFKFQLGKFNSITGWSWFNYLENGLLDSQNYSVNFAGDSLSFSTVAPLSDRFNLAPRRNIIVFDGNKTTLDISNLEKLYDLAGNEIPTIVRDYPVLSLYHLLHIAFVEGCGFSSFQTNIPNFEVDRCDFSVTSTYMESISGLIGAVLPMFFVVGNVLWILNRFQTLPDEFAPEPLVRSKILAVSTSKPSSALIDGYILSYQAHSAGGLITERLKQETVPHGSFGDPNFTETEINQIFKDWISDSGVLLKTEKASEIRTTYKGASVIKEITEIHTFDSGAKRTETRLTERALVPELPSGEPSLQTVKSLVKQFFYQTDPNDLKKVYCSKIITNTSGLISVDPNNTYFGEPFKQDYLTADQAGNLNEDMTTESGDWQTIIETFTPLGNGQVERTVSGTDHINNSALEDFSEVRAGDISFNSRVSKSMKVVVWKDGVNPVAPKGNRLSPMNIGLMPLFYGITLAEQRLARDVIKPAQAQVEMLGFAEELERGQYLAIEGKNETLGNFILEGFSIRGDQSTIKTSLDATEI